MPISDPSYTNVSFSIENEISAWVNAVASPEVESETPRTALYHVLNALLDFSISEIRENEIPDFENWELLALVNHFQKVKFRQLDPDQFFVKVANFNPLLAEKISKLPRRVRLRLLLTILYERKNGLAEGG